jgi:hypothetical protein
MEKAEPIVKQLGVIDIFQKLIDAQYDPNFPRIKKNKYRYNDEKQRYSYFRYVFWSGLDLMTPDINSTFLCTINGSALILYLTYIISSVYKSIEKL